MRTEAQRENNRRNKRRKQAMARLDPVGMKHAGIQSQGMIPPEEIEALRIWDKAPDTRTITGYIMGDPIPARSALAQRGDHV